ncbi:hypothetical protein ACWPKO_25055 (plasmid) [Coraliomargarita sp. W4R53]
MTASTRRSRSLTIGVILAAASLTLLASAPGAAHAEAATFASSEASVSSPTASTSQMFTESTTWTVPAGMTSFDIEVTGAAGGDAARVSGGRGAVVSGRVAVVAGQTLQIVIGEKGDIGGADAVVYGPDGVESSGVAAAGYGAGGVGGGAGDCREPGAGGGASSAVTIDGALLAVAAGGGGAGGNFSAVLGGAGGSADHDGAAAGHAVGPGADGSGGAADGGGAAGALGGSGTVIGADGMESEVCASSGGGGGGGGPQSSDSSLFGGGQGGEASLEHSGGGGGGGGVSFIGAELNSAMLDIASQSNKGAVVITSFLSVDVSPGVTVQTLVDSVTSSQDPGVVTVSGCWTNEPIYPVTITAEYPLAETFVQVPVALDYAEIDLNKSAIISLEQVAEWLAQYQPTEETQLIVTVECFPFYPMPQLVIPWGAAWGENAVDGAFEADPTPVVSMTSPAEGMASPQPSAGTQDGSLANSGGGDSGSLVAGAFLLLAGGIVLVLRVRVTLSRLSR